MRTLTLRRGLVLLVSCLVAAAMWTFVHRGDAIEISADFERTTGLYRGNDVTVLGVKVGEIISIDPDGEIVEVRMKIDDDYDLPANVKAVVMQRSLVTDRYVELTPSYDHGERLADDAHIPIDRTVSPIGADDVFRSINRLLEALNHTDDGNVSRLLSVTAENLSGNGDNVRRILTALRKLAALGVASGEELTEIVEGLDAFTHALSRRNALVNRFSTNLTDVTVQFAGDRRIVAKTLTELNDAMSYLAAFVRENRAAFTQDITKVVDLGNALAKHRQQLLRVLDLTGLSYQNNARILDKNGRVVVNANLAGTDFPSRILEQLCEGPLSGQCSGLLTRSSATGTPLPLSLRDILGAGG